MQERPLASKSPLGSFVGTPSEETQAVAAEQLQQRQQAPVQLHHPRVSPFTHASQQQRQPSSDLSEDDCPGDLEVSLPGGSRAGHGLYAAQFIVSYAWNADRVLTSTVWHCTITELRAAAGLIMAIGNWDLAICVVVCVVVQSLIRYRANIDTAAASTYRPAGKKCSYWD